MSPDEYEGHTNDAVPRAPVTKLVLNCLRYRGKSERRTRLFVRTIFSNIFHTPQENNGAFPHELWSQEIEIQRSNAQQETGSTPRAGIVTFKDLFFKVQMSIGINNLMASIGAAPYCDEEIMRSHGMREARSMVSAYKDRHQIMLIDDYLTLAAHKADMMQAARVISHVAKTADGAGMELYRAFPDAKLPRICKTSFQIEEAISEMHSVGGICDMVKGLEKVFKRVLIGHKVNPTSVYIYTDGVWKTDVDDLERVILQAMDYIYKLGQPSNTLMVQFIQFGNDAKGTQQLLFLKNRFPQQLGRRHCNILDVRHCEDHIPDIIMGSIPK